MSQYEATKEAAESKIAQLDSQVKLTIKYVRLRHFYLFIVSPFFP
jgi:hypothetical protein